MSWLEIWAMIQVIGGLVGVGVFVIMLGFLTYFTFKGE
ncbi:TMhelix containing protein [Vibrio phage 1.204.O._10N.222.46.F12]|uniref:TMhelix containing protein n=1 Tax=Vibrio phage 1.204.O._10N.222.46.F12 TaxID=1881263 RepID=A0A2I7RNN1_9CAUD|nr:TMhelix containing protein [Vibrio phage 1.204.O._10N.222.46.F12]AUR95248.1 TMhelix containing protein [Vibrio phage 1.204.O._10N.222.46.F12]